MLKLENIYKSYCVNNEANIVLKNINLIVGNNTITTIYGHSGVGKSTLLGIIGGILAPDSGNVIINNNCIFDKEYLQNIRKKSIGFLFQKNNLFPEFTNLENLILPQIINNKNIIQAKERGFNLLSMLKLENLNNKYPYQISNGEKQRISLLKSIVNKPKMVLADEPTAHLDENNCKQIKDLIVKVSNEEKISFIIATHDNRFKKISDNVYKLFDGDLINE